MDGVLVPSARGLLRTFDSSLGMSYAHYPFAEEALKVVLLVVVAVVVVAVEARFSKVRPRDQCILSTLRPSIDGERCHVESCLVHEPVLVVRRVRGAKGESSIRGLRPWLRHLPAAAH